MFKRAEDSAPETTMNVTTTSTVSLVDATVAAETAEAATRFAILLPVEAVATVPDGTYRKRGNNLIPVVKTTGYFVAFSGHELELNGATANDVQRYALKNASDLENGLFVGVWFDPTRDVTCLDLSVWVLDREKAIELGKRERQVAIWDCAAADAIYL